MIEHDLTPQEQDELGDLKPLYDRLEAYRAPEPDSATLLTALKPLMKAETAPEMQTTEAAEAAESVRDTRQVFREWLRLVWIQTKLLEAPYWWAAVLTAGIGLLLSISAESATTMFVLLVVSPLLTVGGVAYIFRPATRTLWELEQFSRFHPLETLYARLALVLTFNIALATALLLVTWTQGAQIVLWRLLLIWLGPMIGLTGLALFCTVRWGTFAGFIAPTLLWTGITFGGWREAIMRTNVVLPDLAGFVTFVSTSNLPLLTAAVGLIVGIVLLVESGRMVTRWR